MSHRKVNAERAKKHQETQKRLKDELEKKNRELREAQVEKAIEKEKSISTKEKCTFSRTRPYDAGSYMTLSRPSFSDGGGGGGGSSLNFHF